LNDAENPNELINSGIYSIAYLILTQGHFQHFFRRKVVLYVRYVKLGRQCSLFNDITKNVCVLPKTALLSLEPETYVQFYCTNLTT
jgi:hypothetical protein